MDSKYHVGELGVGELKPGAAPRRWEPDQGVGKHNARIHRENNNSNKNLPFTFRKPFKPIGRSRVVECDSCGHVSSVSTATVGIICSCCKKFSTVTEV